MSQTCQVLRKICLPIPGKARLFIRSYSATNNKTVGFIGLGNMGSGMADNLISKGYNLNVYDISKDATTDVSKKGGKVSDSPANVAGGVTECIITMLTNNKTVLDVYCGDNGIFSKAKKGTLLIDSSTIDPSVSKDLYAEAKSKGMAFVDAPVSGGVNAAKAGTLTFMVGAEADDFKRASEYLQHMGGKINHCGPVGHGLLTKICNNMLLAISMIGVSEAMNLGIRLGIDPKVLASVINTSTGRCWSSDTYNPVPGVLENVPSSNQYNGGFATKLMTKDLCLAGNIATESLTSIPLGSLAQQIYTSMLDKGYGDKDFTAIYDFLAKKV